MTKGFLKLLSESKNFSGITFKGSFYIDLTVLYKLYEYYKTEGENLLDDYSNLVTLSWRCDKEDNYFNKDEYNSLIETFSKLRRLRVLSEDLRIDSKTVIENGYSNFRKHQEYLNSKPRRTAQKYISKGEVRDKVFHIHGNKCLCCDSENNLSIDHIIPVFKGGENHIGNLQPLCVSCNSKKGTKTIDYRK